MHTFACAGVPKKTPEAEKEPPMSEEESAAAAIEAEAPPEEEKLKTSAKSTSRRRKPSGKATPEPKKEPAKKGSSRRKANPAKSRYQGENRPRMMTATFRMRTWRRLHRTLRRRSLQKGVMDVMEEVSELAM